MKIKNISRISAAIIALALGGTAAQAAISDDNETVTVQAPNMRGSTLLNERDFRSEQVSFSDLNLNRAEDFNRLQMRISSSAGRLCDSVKGGDVWNLTERQLCINTSVHDAMAQIPAFGSQPSSYEAQATYADAGGNAGSNTDINMGPED